MLLRTIRKGIDASVGRVFTDAVQLLHPGRELFALAGHRSDAIAARRTAFLLLARRVHWIQMLPVGVIAAPASVENLHSNWNRHDEVWSPPTEASVR